ncbi:MAG: G8 domain-containing protein, partial [Bacteroidia bacterium]|nr:G8 domain-containing protein [Bacteroidia bacterium]
MKHTYFDSNRKSICHGRIVPIRWITFLLFFFVNLNSAFSQATVTASGTWSTATWSPAAPVAGQSVIVNVGCTLTVDQSTPPLNDLTINGVVIISNTAVSIMTIGGNITVNAGGRLENNGAIEFTTLGKNFTLNGTATYVHNPRNSGLLDESIFELSNEVFSATSNLIIQKWFDPSVPLGSADRVQSSIFGNVTLSAPIGGPGNWDQDGCFALPVSNRIRGKLTVTEGTIVMDDGTGNTSNLALGDVDILNNGNIVFQRGQNRSLTMTSGNFNLNNNIAARTTTVMDTSFGVLNWTITGNMTINGNFNAVFGNNYSTGADIRITVNGNLTISAGISNFINKADAPLRGTVSGATTLSGMSGGTFCTFIEGGNGNLTFTTTDLVVSGGPNWYFNGCPTSGLQSKGASNITINNDFNLTGTSNVYFAWADSMANKTTVRVVRDFNLSGGGIVTNAYTNGAATFRVQRNWNQTSGKFNGQFYTLSAGLDSIIVGTNFTFNSATASDYFSGNRGNGITAITCGGNWNVLNSGNGTRQGVVCVDSSASVLNFTVTGNFVQNGGRFIGSERGSGNINITVNGILDMNAGTFRGILNTTYSV